MPRPRSTIETVRMAEFGTSLVFFHKTPPFGQATHNLQVAARLEFQLVPSLPVELEGAEPFPSLFCFNQQTSKCKVL